MSFLFESPVKTVEELPSLKYYPIFDKRWSSTVKTNDNQSSNKNSGSVGGKIKRPRSTGKINRARKPYAGKTLKRLKLFDSTEQYVLDFGQKNFDAKRCHTCNMLYTVGEIIDEKTHEEYHDMFVNSLKYREWKNEDIVNQYDDGRVLRILPSSPHYMHKKLDELFKIADLELGINVDLKSSMKPTSQFFLFITSQPTKRIVGFVAAERIKLANKLLNENPLMASTDEYPAECGISRIWTHPNFRRRQIATRLLDTLRQVFFKDKIIPLDRLAFSDPTVIGKDFAKSYTKMDKFLIYLYRHIVINEEEKKLIH